MKKRLTNSSKRKWIVSGVLAFGAACLLTTGFATWIIGVNNSSEDIGTDVEIGTATNNSVNLVMEVDSKSKLTLKETEEVKGGSIVNTDTDIDENALTLNLSKFTLSAGNTYLKENKITGISFEFAYDNTDTTYSTGSNKVASGDNLIGRNTSETPFEYIACPETIKLEDKYDEKADESTVVDYSDQLTNKTLTFKWGSYFDGKSPATFYNSFFSGKEITNDDVSHVQKELDQFHTALNGKKILVTASLVTETRK